MNPRGWQVVDSFTTGSALHTLETTIADAGLRSERVEADDGGRALVAPVRPLAEGKAPGIAVTDAPVGAVEVLFLDPANGASALSLLAALGDRARQVRVALPVTADATGLIPEAGRVMIAVGAESPDTCQLFRAADRRTLEPNRPVGAPKLGEEADVLEQRSKWFQTREGQGD